MIYNLLFLVLDILNLCYNWWEDYIKKNKNKKEENKEGKDSNEPVSKNQWLKWNIIKYRNQNENTHNL